ncbi:MAG: GH3 auxin-responsive promoter family protein [Bacteroidales bacterium]
MQILNSLVNTFSKSRLATIENFMNKPHEVQDKVFQGLIDKAKDTEWGRMYNYGNIKSIETFDARVPISVYDGLRAMFEKQMRGEPNIMWPGRIRWFAKSSGTTANKSKFIPISTDSLEHCHYRGGKDVIIMHLCNYPKSRILEGKSLTLGGSHSIDPIHGFAHAGDLSAILIRNMPWWTNFRRTPSANVSLIKDFERKIEHIAESSISKTVTSMFGVPSWYLVLLNKILEVSGKNNIAELWPKMQVFVHGGIKFDPYREQYKKIIPIDDMVYMETYNASEGFFGIQDQKNSSEMLLMLDYGVFYEFIEMSKFYDEHPSVIPLSQVKEGVNYAMLISTNGGLWRYIIGDTVSFTSTSPYRFKITGRTKYYINAFGEEVMHDNAEQALLKACKATSSEINEYTVGPVFMEGSEKGQHEWIIEFAQSPDSIDEFVDILDKALQEVNSDYEAKRFNDATLKKLKIRVVDKGTFMNWMKSRGKLGGQNKVPRLSNDRSILDSIYLFVDNKQG